MHREELYGRPKVYPLHASVKDYKLHESEFETLAALVLDERRRNGARSAIRWLEQTVEFKRGVIAKVLRRLPRHIARELTEKQASSTSQAPTASSPKRFVGIGSAAEPVRRTPSAFALLQAAYPKQPARLSKLEPARKIDLKWRAAGDVRRNGSGRETMAASLEDKIEHAVRNDTTITETERQAVILARRGQGKFRSNVEAIEPGCRLTGVTDSRLLRAGHIMPWRSCTDNRERLDGNNGLLLAPHVDHLFDRGFISFADDGTVLLSPVIPIEQFKRLGIRPSTKVRTFSRDQCRYLAHHREHVFVSGGQD
jgi:hypothetical protein